MITPCEERRRVHGCHASALPRHFVPASACPLRAGRCGVRGRQGGNMAPHLLPWGLPHSGTALGASLPLCPCSEDSDVLGPCGACQGGTWSQGCCVGPSPASRLGRTLLFVPSCLAEVWHWALPGWPGFSLHPPASFAGAGGAWAYLTSATATVGP